MRLLVVEDEPELATEIVGLLRAEGWAADLAADLAAARLSAGMHDYDAAVLDRRLPDGDGLDLCAEWREEGRPMPILMLTALDGPDAIVGGLEVGADDYLVKPFDAGELVARIRALMRRAPVAPRPVLAIGSLEIDRARRRVRSDGVVVPLTSKEFAVLEHLALADHGVVDRYELLEHCWDHAAEPESNVVDVHIRALRRKLGADTIETVRGAGYRLAEAP